jgi:hypothetical protein
MKINCYNCIFRSTVAGSVHSSCTVLRELSKGTDQEENLTFLEFNLAANKVTLFVDEEPAIKLNPHGVAKGWAMWPLNFDPIWVEDCKFFKNKEENENNI